MRRSPADSAVRSQRPARRPPAPRGRAAHPAVYRGVYRAGRSLAAALAAAYVLWTVTSAISPERHHAARAWWWLALVGVIGGLGALAARRRLRPAAAERVAFAVAVLLTASTIGYLIQTGDPKETTNVMLVVIGASIAFPSLWSFGLVVAMAAGAWVYARVTIPGEDWTYFGVAMASSLLVAAAVFASRRASARRLAEVRAELRDMAVVDVLTGLHNRRGFDVLAEQAMLDADRSGAPFVLLFVDVDEVADTGDGERMVDQARLQESASLLRSAFRGADVVARLGGRHFCALLPAASPGVSYTDRLHSAVIEANARDGRGYTLGLSLDEAWYDPARPEPIDELVAGHLTRLTAQPAQGR